MHIVTGGAGFIGSAIVWKLNQSGINDIVIVDHLGETDKWRNLVNLSYSDYVDKDDFLKMILTDSLPFKIDTIFHMGACSATTEKDADYLVENNYRYTKILADWCIEKSARFIYASSAATYGDGSMGYNDSEDDTLKLKPMNMYGYSKQMFDLYAIRKNYFDSIVGLKFFNVFGPNEQHKDDMRSVIHKSYPVIKKEGQVSLFKSHKDGFKDGEQKRDFIYIKDILEIVWFFFENKDKSGLFNAGTGKARSFNDLVKAIFSSLNKKPRIKYFDMPVHLRDRYQYFTQANCEKLFKTGYTKSFTSLEDGIKDYILNYLENTDPYLGNRI
ncbi:MAG: ADP-glyceromanno-heptose 6-epimerase [Spirochaetes bacterium]|nr:ADP-glyceromanno-heptose 6-epimerase [Spirochaetota bacterium]